MLDKPALLVRCHDRVHSGRRAGNGARSVCRSRNPARPRGGLPDEQDRPDMHRPQRRRHERGCPVHLNPAHEQLAHSLRKSEPLESSLHAAGDRRRGCGGRRLRRCRGRRVRTAGCRRRSARRSRWL